MSTTGLIIRKLNDGTLAKLRDRAAQHGVSIEEEARKIINEIVSIPERLGDLAVHLFAPVYGGTELELPERTNTDPIEFSE